MLLYERMARKSMQRYNKFLIYASFWAFFLLNRIKFYVLWTEGDRVCKLSLRNRDGSTALISYE